MNTTDLPSAIRECIDGAVNPVTSGEIRARAVMTEPAARRAPARRRARAGVAAAGLAAAGIAGTLVAGQVGGGPAGTGAVLTAAVLKHLAGTSRAAMTSGQADIAWSSGGNTVVQQVAFDGANWRDTMPPAGARPAPGLRAPAWTGKKITMVVDGQAYHYPAFAFTPKPHITAGWMRILAPGAAQSLDFPDPRTLLGVLSPSAGFAADGYVTIGGVRLKHLRATTPGAVPAAPLDPIVQSEPDGARVSALDLWVSPAGVVVKARVMMAGAGKAPGVTVTVTFSRIGQSQAITAPARFITVGGKG